jgi:hypothetical protein
VIGPESEVVIGPESEVVLVVNEIGTEEVVAFVGVLGIVFVVALEFVVEK